MIISVNWLKKYTDIDVPIDILATRIGERLVEIESVIDLSQKYKDVIVAKVVECEPMEGSDHLSVTKIDDGGVVSGVERDDKGLVRVVCGANNVRSGLTVAWLPPKSVVPETFGTETPFILSAKPLRGVTSNGMLASARELDLYDDHTGILEIDKQAAPGASFAELYELNDYLLDIDNKSLTHRPDTFGIIGFAREVAGIFGKNFQTPDWLGDLGASVKPTGDQTVTDKSNHQIEPPQIHIDSKELSDRFQAIIMTGFDETTHSPIQMQTYLARSGVRPINASVDVSNYLMLMTGQPSHAYDYDKLKAVAGKGGDTDDNFTINVRLANANESLTLLDGKEVKLDESDIVIAAGQTAIGLAGIMGGESTKTDETTKTILLEVATFNLYRMRSSQMRHGIFSEAVTRFTKGIPATLGRPVAVEAARLLGELAGANVASEIVEDYPGKHEPIIVKVTSQRVNQTLGTEFAAEDIAELLENVGFEVKISNLEAVITVPYWREDIHIPEDIIEEVGRLAGFDTINLTLPRRDFVAVRPNTFDNLRSKLRAKLVRAGANEVLTYSFVHGDILTKASQDKANSYQITNSLSPDLQYYRQSLTPSLLNIAFANVKAGFNAFALFEFNKVHNKSDGLTDENVPVENSSLALVLIDAKKTGSAYYQAKALLEYTLSGLGIDFEYSELNVDDSYAKPFEPKRSAAVYSQAGGKLLGVIGEYKKSVRKNFKLPDYSAGFEIDPSAIKVETEAEVKSVTAQYQPLSRYPGTERDICFQVSNNTTYEVVVKSATSALESQNLIFNISPLDIYQSEGASTKNITIRINLASYEKTMTAEEATLVINTVINQVIKATDGKVI